MAADAPAWARTILEGFRAEDIRNLVFLPDTVMGRLLAVAERNPSIGFGVLLLFVVFEFGFTVTAMLFAAPVLKALTWPAVLVANLLAAAAMGGYFWLRHPALRVSP